MRPFLWHTFQELTHYGLEQQWLARIQQIGQARRSTANNRLQQIISRDPWFLLTAFGDGDDDDVLKGKSWTVKVSTVMLQCYLLRNPGSTMTGSIWQTGGWTNQYRGFTALVQSFLGRRVQASNCRRTWNRKTFCKTILYEGRCRHCLTLS